LAWLEKSFCWRIRDPNLVVQNNTSFKISNIYITSESQNYSLKNPKKKISKVFSLFAVDKLVSSMSNNKQFLIGISKIMY
jgi:hypothetical protein